MLLQMRASREGEEEIHFSQVFDFLTVVDFNARNT